MSEENIFNELFEEKTFQKDTLRKLIKETFKKEKIRKEQLLTTLKDLGETKCCKCEEELKEFKIKSKNGRLICPGKCRKDFTWSDYWKNDLKDKEFTLQEL